jgi:hypothetical protein
MYPHTASHPSGFEACIFLGRYASRWISVGGEEFLGDCYGFRLGDGGCFWIAMRPAESLLRLFLDWGFYR